LKSFNNQETGSIRQHTRKKYAFNAQIMTNHSRSKILELSQYREDAKSEQLPP